MAMVRNILFIMCDQLRADYLSCYGHRTLNTPHIDRLAKLGTKFTRAYVQGSVCGSSRASFYTGRYVASHGATWNFVPLSVGEKTLGDYMRQAGLRTALVGKTHVFGDVAGIARMGLNPQQDRGLLLAQGGFEPYFRHDGVVLSASHGVNPYNAHLAHLGYGGTNPWHDFANSVNLPDGTVGSGWRMRNARFAARIPCKDSETAVTTDRAIDFIREQGDAPWCLHLSYIKPHWPYMAPSPYHQLFGEEDILSPVRNEQERTDAHPVYRAFRNHEESLSFSKDEVRKTVVPTYMGLIKQIDDEIGRLLKELEAYGRMTDTMIVFTSDHGDFLGDHWLGEKEILFEQAVRIPMIVVDPSANAQRGATCDALVQAIDLIPTFLEALDQPDEYQILEGESLLPIIRAGKAREREAVFCELDYSFSDARRELQVHPDRARSVMVRTVDKKLIHHDGFPPQFYDLANDPGELEDLGQQNSARKCQIELQDRLFEWARSLRNRTTMSAESVLLFSARSKTTDIAIGRW